MSASPIVEVEGPVIFTLRVIFEAFVSVGGCEEDGGENSVDSKFDFIAGQY